jgi:ATP-dependent Zn protease
MKIKVRIAIVSAVVICLAALWWITGSQIGLAKMTYSQFLEQVRAGQVTSVIVIDSKSGATRATCRLRDGKTVQTVLPSNYAVALAAMQDKLVNIDIQGPSFFINADPFLLLLGVWILVVVGKFPHRIRAL